VSASPTHPTTERPDNPTPPAGAGSYPTCPKCGAEQRGQPITDPDGRRVCGECGHAWDLPDDQTDDDGGAS
jgi:hypothetical protein